MLETPEDNEIVVTLAQHLNAALLDLTVSFTCQVVLMDISVPNFLYHF